MTTANHTIHYHLSAESDLERLLGEFHEIQARNVVIAFDPNTGLTPSDLHLARLVAASRTHGRRLIVETGDPILASRALTLGFDDSAVVSDRPDVHIRDTGTIAPVILARSDDPDTFRTFQTTSSLATYRPEPAQPAAVPASSDEDGGEKDAPYQHLYSRSGTFHTVSANWTSSESNTVSQAVGRSAKVSPEAPTAMIATGLTGHSSQAEATESDSGEINQPREHAPRPRRKRTTRRRGMILAAAIVAPLVVIGVVAAMAVYLLPTAEVSIIPGEDTISSSVTYGIAVDGASYDIMLDPTPISSSSSAEATREATGERYEPDGTAAGTVQITNPLTSEVTIPAGTELPGANGVTYYTSEDLRIPAADPFGSLSFGSASVGVYAGIIGPDANLDAGSLTGQLGSGLFFTNPEAISGGTMRAITIIEQEDLDTVASDVEHALLDKAEREFLEQIPDGYRLVPDSLEISEPEIEVVGEAGADGNEVSASGTIDVRGQVFDPEELHEHAKTEAGLLLNRQGGNERVLLANTVAINDPAALDDHETAFRVEANATVREMITSAEKEAIVDQLVGRSREDAEALLAEHPKIQHFEIVIEPDWLPDRFPEITSRIDVHVSSSEQTTATR